MTFTSEITAPVMVDVRSYTPPIAGRYDDIPERCEVAEPAEVELVVTLGGVDVTDALPPGVLDELRAEALQLLADGL